MAVNIERLSLKDISITKTRQVSYQKKPMWCLLPKVPMASSLTLYSGSPSRGSFILDLTSSPETVTILERLDDWILRVAKKLEWFPDEDLHELYTPLIRRKDDQMSYFRVSFPIWGDMPNVEVYNQDRQLMEYPLSELDSLSQVRVLLHFQGIWLSGSGFGWNIQPIQVMVFNEDDLPKGYCLVDDVTPDDVTPDDVTLDGVTPAVNSDIPQSNGDTMSQTTDEVPHLMDEYDEGEDDEL